MPRSAARPQPHRFRRTFAVNLIERGATLRDLAKLQSECASAVARFLNERNRPLDSRFLNDLWEFFAVKRSERPDT